METQDHQQLAGHECRQDIEQSHVNDTSTCLVGRPFQQSVFDLNDIDEGTLTVKLYVKEPPIGMAH